MFRMLLILSVTLSCLSAHGEEEFRWSASFSVRSRDGAVFEAEKSVYGKGAESGNAYKMAHLTAEQLTREYIYSLERADGHHPEPIVIERVVPHYIPTPVPVPVYPPRLYSPPYHPPYYRPNYLYYP